jgi:thiamine-phosphate pyrophosphorylase
VVIPEGFWTLRRTAALLRPARPAGKALPRLLFFTDPVRTPDPEAAAATLPRGTAIVLRAFGSPGGEALARRLAAIARRRGLKLLIGADIGLAQRVGAAGVHLPERLAGRAGAIRRSHPGWIVTAAAHSPRAAQAVLRAGAQAAVVSTAFASRSASAGRPMGAVRMTALARAAPGPVYALGGITNKTARRLKDAGLVGLAAVEGLYGHSSPASVLASPVSKRTGEGDCPP